MTDQPRTSTTLVDSARTVALLARSSGWVEIRPGSLRRAWWGLLGPEAWERGDVPELTRDGWVAETPDGAAIAVREDELRGVRCDPEAIRAPKQLRLWGAA